MAVLGTGIDIVEIERLEEVIARRGHRFVDRVFTEAERAYCDRRADAAPHYAARFAAKEATAKAVGRSLRWHDVEVTKDPAGRPQLVLHGGAAALPQIARGGRLTVSLSHSRDYAVACVLLAAPQEIACPDQNLPDQGVWT